MKREQHDCLLYTGANPLLAPDNRILGFLIEYGAFWIEYVAFLIEYWACLIESERL